MSNRINQLVDRNCNFYMITEILFYFLVSVFVFMLKSNSSIIFLILFPVYREFIKNNNYSCRLIKEVLWLFFLGGALVCGRLYYTYSSYISRTRLLGLQNRIFFDETIVAIKGRSTYSIPRYYRILAGIYCLLDTCYKFTWWFSFDYVACSYELV